jgi:NACHT domain
MGSESTDPNDIETLQRQIAELQAKLSAAQQANVSGSGAIAHGGGDALGERSIKVEENSGTIVTGTQIVTNYYAASGQLTKEEIAQQVVGYLLWLQARTKSIELRGIERAGGAPVVLLPLETAYVPLRARSMPRVGDAQRAMVVHGRPSRSRRDRADDAEHDEREADIALNEVLGLGKRLVITGGPGSGKTTVLLHMAWALASSLLTGQPDPAQSRLGLTLAPSELPLPIFVPLASFARYRRNLVGNAPARERTLAHFISHHLISKQADFDLPTDFFVQLLKDGRDVLLLLDGLDEVANENERAEVRQSVEDLVSGRGAMRVVVTCRTVAYRSGRTALGADFREIAVQPLDSERHIAPMVAQAYACIHPYDAALRADRVDDLLDGILRLEEERHTRLGHDTEAMVNSPLIVRLLLIVHVNNRTLPDERADLFDKAINALLQVDYGREESDIRELSTDWKLFRDMAQHLAFHMHQQGRDQGREIEEPVLKRTLRMESEFQPRIDDFLSHARQRGSVLEERNGAYRFIHLASQEFLVARYLREVTGGESREAILAFLNDRLDDPWWREPILLLAGYMGSNAAKSARDFLGALARAGSQPNAQFSAAEIAGTAALEWRESGEAIRGDCARCIVELLSDWNRQMHSKPVVRAGAGDTLAALGDPRFDPQRFHLPADDMLGFVRIAADPEFRIGTRKADRQRVAEIIGAKVPDDEINDLPTPTPEFYIGRFPVSVAQFRAFVEATQFEIGSANALRDPVSRPVRYVS